MEPLRFPSLIGLSETIALATKHVLATLRASTSTHG